MALTGEYVPSPASRTADQVEEYERSGGTSGNLMRGMPVVIVTMRGAKTGNIRKIAVMRVEHDGDYAVIASMGGAPEHPRWFHNLVANPEVELQDGPEPRSYTARLVSGEERARWWDRAVAAYPDYAEYQTRTSREIPVFVLEPR